jgi:hypothetical protein
MIFALVARYSPGLPVTGFPRGIRCSCYQATECGEGVGAPDSLAWRSGASVGRSCSMRAAKCRNVSEIFRQGPGIGVRPPISPSVP